MKNKEITTKVKDMELITTSIQLGAGLIGIGREWGHRTSTVPTQEQALQFLQAAYRDGITYFDTAPSYGSSEERLGIFFQSLSPEQQAKVTIGTKFGEHWDPVSQTPYADHRYEALCQSIDQSLSRLGRIDLLQVHKTTPAVLESSDLRDAITYARKQGITHFGASVSDEESAGIVCTDPTFTHIQFPFNEVNQQFGHIIDLAQAHNKTVLINRPFNMGAILYENGRELTPEEQKIKAYNFIKLRLMKNAIVLTGTKDPKHLNENITAFYTK